MHRHILNSVSVDSKMHDSSPHSPKPSMADTTERILAVCFVLLGLACIFWTHTMHKVFPFLLGCIMFVLGTHHVYYGVRTREYMCHETKLIANGIVYLILALVILVRNQNADPMIGGIWGVIGLITGVEELNSAIYHYARKEKYIWISIRALVEVTLGILLLIDPVSAVGHHIFILGMELMVEGLKLFFLDEPDLDLVEAGIGESED